MRLRNMMSTTAMPGRLLPLSIENGDPNDSAGAGDNTGDSKGGGGDSPAEDNTSTAVDFGSFWNPSGGDGPSLGESPESTPPGNQQTQQEKPKENSLGDMIGALKFAPDGGIMSESVMTELNEGNTESFDQRMDSFGQNIMGQSANLMVGMFERFTEHVAQMIDSRTAQSHDSRDNDAALIEAFPAAKNPVVRPMYDKVFTQALKNTKGDREKAITQTREMMKTFSGLSADDLGLDVRPAQDGDVQLGAPVKVDWKEELKGALAR